MITAIETIRSVARTAADDPAPRRASNDDPGVAAPEGGPPAANLGGMLPRVVMMLIQLLVARTPEGSTLRIVAQALATFLPLFGLDWLPSDPGVIPRPTTRDHARIHLLRQERDARARRRASAARHRPAQPARPAPQPATAASSRVQPDRPPASRTAANFGLPANDDDQLWHELLDLTSETLETFIGFDHQDGVRHCADLIELFADTFGEGEPKAA